MRFFKTFLIPFIFPVHLWSEIPEMILGEETIENGINLVFEVAIKDDVSPSNFFGNEENSDIHLEVLANWNDSAPEGSQKGGFVPYLNVSAELKNQKTQITKSIDLLPHLNLSDNFHYALNTKLPGMRTDIYTIKFFIKPPDSSSLGYHYDWNQEVGSLIPKVEVFEYSNLDLETISNASRR